MSNTAEIINFPNKTEQPGGRMADLSNGYTKVANEIQQLKPRLRLSGREWQCFEAVIWLTYGWNKKQDRVTNTVIAELTGLSDTHVSDALKSLAERKIIFSQKQGMMKIVGVNTDLSAWILDKPETGRKFPKTGKSFPKSGITFPKTVDTQYKNKNSIKRSSSENSDESSDARLKKFLSTHPEAAVPGKQSHAKGSHIPLVQPVEYSTASWRRAVLSLEEHQKAWLLWNYSENTRWENQLAITQWAWAEFRAQLGTRKIAGKTMDRLKALIWLAAQDVKKGLRGGDKFTGVELADLTGVEEKNWYKTFGGHWQTMQEVLEALDRDALRAVSRSRSQQKAAHFQQGIAKVEKIAHI